MTQKTTDLIPGLADLLTILNGYYFCLYWNSSLKNSTLRQVDLPFVISSKTKTELTNICALCKDNSFLTEALDESNRYTISLIMAPILRRLSTPRFNFLHEGCIVISTLDENSVTFNSLKTTIEKLNTIVNPQLKEKDK